MNMNTVQFIESKLKTGELVLIRRFTPYKSGFYFFLCALNCAEIVMNVYMSEYGLNWPMIVMNAVFVLIFGAIFFRSEDYLSITLPQLVTNQYNPAKVYRVGENYFIGFSTADAELFANTIKSTEPVEELTGPVYTHKYE